MTKKPVLSLFLLLVLTTFPARAVQQKIWMNPAAYGLKNPPVIGHTTHQDSRVWVRTAAPSPVKVEVSTDPALKNAAAVSGQTKGDRHNTAVLVMTGLKPQTRYYYRISAAGKTPVLPPGHAWPSFRTLPDPTKPSKIRIGMGSCWLYWASANPKTFSVLAQHQPDVFVWLGDNVYGDTFDAETLFAKHMTHRNAATLQWMNYTLPQWAVWDDHDFGLNDSDSSYRIKGKTIEVFKDVWANASYGEKDNPGIYSKISIGGADLFLLDGRYHRMERKLPDDANKSLLGKRQLAWLKTELKKSNAPFKLLIIGTPWQGDNNPDSFGAYKHERDGLFDYIRDEKIEGVVLVRGDSHIGELNAIPRKDKGGYDLYELVSSPLANKNRGATSGKGRIAARLRPIYWQDFNVGVLDIDTTVTPPRLGFMNYNSKNQPVWKTPFTLTTEELKNGKGDWQSKVAD